MLVEGDAAGIRGRGEDRCQQRAVRPADVGDRLEILPIVGRDDRTQVLCGAGGHAGGEERGNIGTAGEVIEQARAEDGIERGFTGAYAVQQAGPWLLDDRMSLISRKGIEPIRMARAQAGAKRRQLETSIRPASEHPDLRESEQDAAQRVGIAPGGGREFLGAAPSVGEQSARLSSAAIWTRNVA